MRFLVARERILIQSQFYQSNKSLFVLMTEREPTCNRCFIQQDRHCRGCGYQGGSKRNRTRNGGRKHFVTVHIHTGGLTVGIDRHCNMWPRVSRQSDTRGQHLTAKRNFRFWKNSFLNPYLKVREKLTKDPGILYNWHFKLWKLKVPLKNIVIYSIVLVFEKAQLKFDD